MLDRRHFIGALLVSSCTLLASCTRQAQNSSTIPLFAQVDSSEEPTSTEADAIKVAFAALVSPQESFYKYQNLVNYLEKNLGQKIQVIRRQTYKEVNDLLGAGEVDFGFICSLSFVMGIDGKTLTGIAAPVINGSSFYRSYLICRSDSEYAMLEDLKDKTFAFTDPFSYTGRLSTLKLLHDQVGSDESYFHEVFFTYSHDSSIHAVHLGIADAASVDGLIFEELVASQSELVKNLRIIYKGPTAGMPPVVASTHVNKDLRNRFQALLLGMREDAEGQAILDDLGYDYFEIPDESNYETIREALLAIEPQALNEFKPTTQAGG